MNRGDKRHSGQPGDRRTKHIHIKLVGMNYLNRGRTNHMGQITNAANIPPGPPVNPNVVEPSLLHLALQPPRLHEPNGRMKGCVKVARHPQQHTLSPARPAGLDQVQYSYRVIHASAARRTHHRSH